MLSLKIEISLANERKRFSVANMTDDKSRRSGVFRF